MKRAALTALALLAATGTASAGGYVGLGIGPSPGISDAYEPHSNPQGRSLRLQGGYRFGNVSVEAALGGVGVATAHGDDRLYSAWLAGKLSLPLSNGFEFFGRVGLHRVWTSLLDPAVPIDGAGLMAGAGFEYNLNLVATKASIFVDYTLQRATTSASDGTPNTDEDMTLRTWTLGFTVGF
jgi:hypothetical protein